MNLAVYVLSGRAVATLHTFTGHQLLIGLFAMSP